jgi:hypothetical protein
MNWTYLALLFSGRPAPLGGCAQAVLAGDRTAVEPFFDLISDQEGVQLMDDFQVGDQVFLQTVTDYYTGRIVKLTLTTASLDLAAWIPETGRRADSMISGEFDEIEPYPAEWILRVSLASLVSAVLWPHKLPREQR